MGTSKLQEPPHANECGRPRFVLRLKSVKQDSDKWDEFELHLDVDTPLEFNKSLKHVNETLQHRLHFLNIRISELEKAIRNKTIWHEETLNEMALHCNMKCDALRERIKRSQPPDTDATTVRITHIRITELEGMLRDKERELQKLNENYIILCKKQGEIEETVKEKQRAHDEEVRNLLKQIQESSSQYESAVSCKTPNIEAVYDYQRKILECKYTVLEKRGCELEEKLATSRDNEGKYNTEIGNLRRQFQNQYEQMRIVIHELDEAKHNLTEAKTELDDTKNRLSKLMGQKLTDNNPNIADLSDKNRPTKLAERYTELYDNQWTDAFEILDEGNEEETINTLRQILYDTMDFCKKESDEQMAKLRNTILGSENEEGPTDLPELVSKQLKDCRKVAAESSKRHLYQKYLLNVKHSQTSRGKQALKVENYLEECFDVCWFMNIQDPPVLLDSCMKHGQPFNTDVYKAYTHSGPIVDYVVWPSLYLCDGGPILCKGVAQGCGDTTKSQN